MSVRAFHVLLHENKKNQKLKNIRYLKKKIFFVIKKVVVAYY